MTSSLQKKEKKILFLAVVFFLLGALLHLNGVSFGKRDVVAEDIAPPVPPTYVPVPPYSPLRSYPEPETFQSFIYSNNENEIVVQTSCLDTSTAVLIYEVGSDYRISPLDARYNIAHPCGGSVNVSIDLRGRPFIEGRAYYIVRAQQGDGEWYNPY